jgi:hypothetical protein
MPAGAFEITLKHGDFMEVEWWGCEVIREGTGWRHLNLVRIGESHPSQNASGNVVTIHAGWVIDSIIPMHEVEDEHMDVYRCDDYEDESDLDLDALFKEKGIEL